MRLFVTYFWALALCAVAIFLASGHLTITTSPHSKYWDYCTAGANIVLAIFSVLQFTVARYLSLVVSLGCLLIDGIGLIWYENIKFTPGIVLGIIGLSFFALGRKKITDA
jgi:hypothetical protein